MPSREELERIIESLYNVFLCAQLKRNALIEDEYNFEGKWVAIPREDFDKLRNAVIQARECLMAPKATT